MKDRRSWASKNGLYLTSSWRKLRKRVLSNNPTCVMCWSMKKVTPANMVDHIIAVTKDNWGELFLDIDNLQPLCYACHQFKTNQDKIPQKYDNAGKDLMDEILGM